MSLFELESELRIKYGGESCGAVCGVDEAGRGPLAGPVYAAAVILDSDPSKLPGLNDSKKLSPARRDALYDLIRANATAYAVSWASAEEIERLNILEASQLAMRRAVDALPQSPGLVLVDGNIARGFSQRAICVVGGDRRCASIAAASILAKVERDRYMTGLAELYPQYGFERHKGYGTALHRQMLLQYGPCPEHRPLFLRKLALPESVI